MARQNVYRMGKKVKEETKLFGSGSAILMKVKGDVARQWRSRIEQTAREALDMLQSSERAGDIAIEKESNLYGSRSAGLM